jgi:DNA-binding MarR family transcriptional regulator
MPAPHGPTAGAPEIAGAPLAPELTRYLPYLMRRVFAHISANAERSTQPRDFAVLASLADEHISSQQELADRLEINRTIMVKLIDRLAADGYLTRTRNPENRRSYVLALTESGREALDRMWQSVTDRDELITDMLTPDERDRLNGLLRRLLGEAEQTPARSSTEYLITQAFYLLRRRGDAMASAFGLRLRNFAPLAAIDRFGPCPQQQLARYLALTEPAAALIVEELVQAGLVTRNQDPADRRRYALELTELGRQRLADLRDAIETLQAELVKALGGKKNEAELRSLLNTLLPR